MERLIISIYGKKSQDYLTEPSWWYSVLSLFLKGRINSIFKLLGLWRRTVVLYWFPGSLYLTFSFISIIYILFTSYTGNFGLKYFTIFPCHSWDFPSPSFPCASTPLENTFLADLLYRKLHDDRKRNTGFHIICSQNERYVLD